METIHYVVVVLTAIATFFIYHQRLREELINQRIDMLDQFNRQHAENCLDGLKEIKETLKKIEAQLTEHTVNNAAIQIEVERLKTDLDGINGKVNHMERLFEAFAVNSSKSIKE